MNKIFRIVFNTTTGRFVVASEMAKGRTKPGGGERTALGMAVMTGAIGVLSGVSGASYAGVVVNGNPQEATVGCELITDSATTTWTVSNSAASCLAPSLAGSASGQGNPGTDAIFYASNGSNGYEDSLNLGGYLDVWKTATFHGGIAMDGQKITGLANGTAATDAATFGQLTNATRYFKAGGLNDGTDDASIGSYGGRNVAIGAGALGGNTAGGTNVSSVSVGENTVSYQNGVAVGAAAKATASFATAIGSAANATGGQTLAAGYGANASGPQSTAVGSMSAAAGTNSTALGFSASAAGNRSTAIGQQSYVDANTSYGLAVGRMAAVSANGAIAVGNEANVSGVNALAMGYTAKATGDYSQAIGGAASAGGARSVALGDAASASANSSVALGSSSVADRANTISVGTSSSQRQIVNVAAGTQATDAVNVSQLDTATRYLRVNDKAGAVPVIGNYSANGIAIGEGTAIGGLTNTGSAQIAMGYNAKADGNNTIALGVGASVAQDTVYGNTADLIAIGSNSVANYGHSVAIGGNAKANPAGNGTNGFGYVVAVGDSASGTQVHTTVLGALSSATAADATALGYQSVADRANTVSVGSSTNQRQIVNVAAGTQATDAANVGQLNNATRYFKAGGANDGTDDASIVGTSVAVGSGAKAVSGSTPYNTTGYNNSVAIGHNANTGNGAGAIAIGDSAKTDYTGISIGAGADTSASRQSIAMGISSQAAGYAAEAIGYQASAAGGNSVALGVNSSASATDSIAVGNQAKASVANSVALGANSTTTANLASAAYNPGSATLSGTASAANGEVSIGSASKERRLTNLAAGSAATDAVNVSQLQAEDATVDKLGGDAAARLGGGATYSATTGAISAPSYALANANTIGGTTGAAADVGAGFAKVDSALGVLNTTANKGFNISADAGATSQNIAPGGTVKFSAGPNASVTRSGDTITMSVVSNPTFSGLVTANGGFKVGASQLIDMGANKVTNVASGTAATDAVNKSQLDAVAATAMSFTANDASGGVVSRTLGQTLAIKGAASTAGTYSGANLKTVTDPATGTINVQMADSPKFGNVVVNASNSGKIAGVADGLVASGSKEAVNGGQLYTTNQQVTTLDGRVTTAEGNIGTLNTKVTSIDGRVTQNTTDIATINSTIAGMGSTVADAVMYDSAAHDKVTLGAAGTPVQVTNVKAGALSAASTDAVNGSQLYTTNQAVAQNTSDIATVKSDVTTIDGRVTKNEGDISTLNTNVSNLDGRVSNVEGSITSITTQLNNGEVGLVQQDATSRVITVAKASDGGEVNFAGTAGARKLSGVAAGAVTATSTEAVNGSQLKATNDAVAQNAADIDTLDGRVTANEDSIASLDSRVTTNEGDISTLKTDVTSIDGRVTKNEGDISTLNTNVSSLDARVTQNTTDLSSLTTNVSSIDSRVTNVEGSVTNITTQLNNGEIGLVQYDDAAQAVTVAAGKGGASVDFRNAAGASRRLKSVAAGAQDEDAANVGQLKNAMGGTATYDANGAYTGPAYTVTNADGSTSQVNGVGDAISNIDGRVYNNTTQLQTIVTQISGGTIGLVQQSAAGANLTVGKDTDGAAVDFGGTAGARKLVNVADGQVAAGSKEAVNGGQLQAVSQSMAAAIGGGSQVNADGTISAPTFTVTNADGSTSQVHTMGDAVTQIDSRVTNIDNRITNVEGSVANITTQINNGEVGLVKQDAATKEVTVAKDTGGTSVNVAGTAGNRTVTGVAAGVADNDAVNVGQLKQAGVISADGQARPVIAYDGSEKTSITLGDGSQPVAIHNVADGVADHDAVNVGQLNTRLQQASTEIVQEANTYTDSRINDVWNTMDKVGTELAKQDQRISSQGAMSMATAQMASGAAAAAVGNPNGAWSVGVGYEQGQGALSAGYAKPVGKKSQISFGAAFSGNDNSIGVGFAHKL
ncbi:ESPR-type extended signal peptide-containing protein [Lysobacter arvi]|uniref:ESPR-type extended signal peptide-containing protein n=1 Tax=Lysobacter arvi TaxID=3038776 RepID=A0ABU1CIC3_9GAMM|nr:ESPR-type extended signal peptide-containing protein [Lysobacter arvi]MDR0184695.1 ESPR-type extended signal peptide-containing protein [Lysobacter arvi]